MSERFLSAGEPEVCHCAAAPVAAIVVYLERELPRATIGHEHEPQRGHRFEAVQDGQRYTLAVEQGFLDRNGAPEIRDTLNRLGVASHLLQHRPAALVVTEAAELRRDISFELLAGGK